MKKTNNKLASILIVICFILIAGYKVLNTSTTNDVETSEPVITEIENQAQEEVKTETKVEQEYYFRNEKLLNSHYQKHGIEMGFNSAEEYEKAASSVASNPNALHKTESEDGDDVYYIEDTNEFVIVSSDGYIRTYFNPDDGIDYYNRQ